LPYIHNLSCNRKFNYHILFFVVFLRQREVSSSEIQGRNKSKRNGGNKGILSDSTTERETPPNIPPTPIDTTSYFTNKNIPADAITVNGEKGKDDKNQALQWVCEHCERAVFNTYGEACEHEKICPERTKQPKVEKSIDENKSISNKDSAYNNNSKQVHNKNENNAPNDNEVPIKILNYEEAIKLRGGDKIQWVCEFCEDALFDTYQEACEHEATCKYNPKSNSAKNDSEASMSTSTDNNNNISNALPQINAVLPPPLSSIENICSKDILGKERLQWVCVFCEKSVFPTYQEAFEHESICPDNPANNNS